MARRSMGRDKETQTLAEVVVTPRGNYSVYTGEESFTPALSDFFEAKAREARINAANHILHQEEPYVPILPSRETGSRLMGWLGMSDDKRKGIYGVWKDPKTCLYTATGQYGDAGVEVSGNEDFVGNPSKYGFMEIPDEDSDVGDIMVYKDVESNTPEHGTIVTGFAADGQPVVSYSRGGTEPYGMYWNEEEGRETYQPTMQYDKERDWVAERIGGIAGSIPVSYRYVGSDSQKRKWAKEYIKKYGLSPKDIKPAPYSHVEYPDALRVSIPKADGGFLQDTPWNSLSMKEKADVMKVAIRNGIYRLGDIRNKYDELMGSIDSDSSVEYSSGGKIHIAPSKKGTFTAAAKKHGKSVQAFASQVLSHPENYSPAMRKKANFARNASKWHSDGGPLVDAANAHIYDGTTEDSQQMNDDYIYTGAPSQYDFQVTAEAPTIYWDGFNWIGFNALSQRVTKGPNFNPSGARIIKNPQEFENARLAQARRTDINGTHRFAKDIRNFTTDLVLMPAGDVLAEPIGILGGKALSAAAKTKAGKAALQGIESIASKFAKGKPATQAEVWAKDIFPRTQGDVRDKAATIEQARQALIDWVKSPYYKERVSDEALYNVADDVIEDAATAVKNAPIEVKDRSLIQANGVTSPRPAAKTVLPDGTEVLNFNTGLDVSAASDLNEESLYSTILHELEHYMTANSRGATVPKGNIKVIDGGWFKPEDVYFDLIKKIHRGRAKGWQNYIMDQNNALLPKYDSVVKMVMEEPEKAKSLFMQAGKTAEEAQQKVTSMQDYYSYLYNIQEQRAFLQELFHTKIKPNIKNPNNASEVESYLVEHPEILEDFPAFKRIQEIRPGNIKQYASYFASALSTLPFISKQVNNE